MRIPNREEVVRNFTEEEAFLHANKLYCDWITNNTPPSSKEIVNELEEKIFKPAMLLQLAGLSLICQKDLDEPNHMLVALACHAVDLELWGWFAAVNFHPRIGFTLSRSALESAIFGIAATQNYSQFMKIWKSEKGTGGYVLSQLKNISEDTRWLLKSSWKLMAALGHASDGPVLSSLTKFKEGSNLKTGITFAGQFAGPLDAFQLQNCGNAFCLAGISVTKFFSIGIKSLMSNSEEWENRFKILEKQENEIVPIPKFLEGKIDDYRKKFGKKPNGRNTA